MAESQTYLCADDHLRLDHIGDMTLVVDPAALIPQSSAVSASPGDDANVDRHRAERDLRRERVGRDGHVERCRLDPALHDGYDEAV